jgi:NADPH:quinone reductase-like Zn-dependent oxidoreductase
MATPVGSTMRGVVFPGNSTIEFQEVEVPAPGHRQVLVEVSKLLIHQQLTLYGSWVTSLQHMEQLAERLARWGLHPEDTVSDRLPLDEAARAYELADAGQSGKVCIVFD